MAVVDVAGSVPIGGVLSLLGVPYGCGVRVYVIIVSRPLHFSHSQLRENLEQPSLFSFCCHVCTKINWLAVVSRQQERVNRMEGDVTGDKQGSGDSLLSTTYGLVLLLMVMVSQDPNIASGQEVRQQW